MTRRILITGGFGYVGSRIAQVLAQSPDTEIVLGSRLPRAVPAWLPQASVVATPWHDLGKLKKICVDIDIVLHLAAMNEIDALLDPVGALEINGVHSVRLLEAAQAEGVASFFYLSTAHVYGAPLCGTINEATLPRPRHPYATSHRAAEDAVLAAHDSGKIAGIVLRLSNSFGAPVHAGVDRWTLLINDLCRQAVKNKVLSLRSSGLQRRDFVTLHDVSRAFEHLLTLPKDKIGDGLFNIGGQWTPRIIDVAKLVQERCGVVLGYTPELTYPQGSGEVSLELTYSIEKLLDTGFVLTGDAQIEIDATLRFCHSISEHSNG